MVLARIKYAKGQELKYISHLDLQRCFHRLLKRTGIDIAYSQGFNPHPKVSYAMAMPVGMTSEGEYLDVELESSIDEEDFRVRLNQKAPSGLEIMKVKLYSGPQKSLSAMITESSYLVTIYLKEGTKNGQVVRAIEEIMEKDSISLSKKNKKGKMVTKDIRSLIKELKVAEVQEGKAILNMRLATGSMENLNPKMLIDYIIKENDFFEEVPFPRVHRLEMIVKGDKTPID